MNAIKEFAISFSSLTLHAVNLLLWKKILSLTLFKIITVSRSSIFLRVFLMGILGCSTKGGNEGVFLQAQVWTFPFCWIPTRPKSWVYLSLPRSQTTYWKKWLFDNFYQKFCLWSIFSVTQSWLNWISSLELNP